MTLPAPDLDDRRFQDIVDEAKRLIPRFCPEWTDHNVSDPGVAMIELFAWMTDLLLYRVNQVPRKVHVRLLEMLGIELAPPEPASAELTFYLSAPQGTAVTIPAGTEVSTIRTETDRPIVFTTDADLVVTPPEPSGLFVAGNARADWTARDLEALGRGEASVPLFPDDLRPGGGFHLAFRADPSSHVLSVEVTCRPAQGAGIDPADPPLVWEAWRGPNEFDGWRPCVVEEDGTGGFNHETGTLRLRLPQMTRRAIEGHEAYWLRCRLVRGEEAGGRYEVSPELRGLSIAAVGASGTARHGVVVEGEVVGRSDGEPGQRFRLRHAPVLRREPGRERLHVTPPGGTEEAAWVEVADFATSTANDPHYVLDAAQGIVELAPTLLQPDGSAYAFGAVPPRGSTLTMSRYRHGGGVLGNVPADALRVLRAATPYVARVTNHAAASGGRDVETVDDAIQRAPLLLRDRTRAVTRSDHVVLAEQVAGVARVACFGPGDQDEGADDVPPGRVRLAVLPVAAGGLPTEGPIAKDQMDLTAELRQAVYDHVKARQPIGVHLDVTEPHYVRVSVRVDLVAEDDASRRLREEAGTRAEAALYAYLNPYLGGRSGMGWPFGRALHASDVYGLVQGLPGIAFVEAVTLRLVAEDRFVTGRLPIPAMGLVCSARHEVRVR